MPNWNTALILNSLFVVVLSGCASVSDDSGTRNEYATIEGLISQRPVLVRQSKSRPATWTAENEQGLRVTVADDSKVGQPIIRASSHSQLSGATDRSNKIEIVAD